MKQFLPKMLVFICSVGLMTGCHHQPKSTTAQQPPLQAQAPTVTEPATHPVQMEVIPLEPERDTTVAAAPAPVTTPPPPVKPEKHRKTTKPQPSSASTASTQPPAPAPAATPPATPPPAASQTPPATAPTTTAATPTRSNANSPIGQLTEGDISGSAQVQEETEKLIKNTESGLAGLQRPLTAQEQETAKQIRKFIEQARDALTAQDAGGAHTLAVKANLLLAELKK
jgi:hypothetical protein